MKNLVMADGAVGETLTKWLLQYHRDDIACIVTTRENVISECCKEHDIPCHTYTNDTNFIEFHSSLKMPIEYGFLLWWPYIIKPAILKLANKGFINTHPSLLPYNRGKHYNFWAIVEEAPFGVTLHFVEPEIDSGDIVSQEFIPYNWEDTGETLYRKAIIGICDLFKTTYPLILSDKFNRTPQDLNKGSFHLSREINEACRIDLNKAYTARSLLNIIRARTFHGMPACYFADDGKFYEVRVSIGEIPHETTRS